MNVRILLQGIFNGEMSYSSIYEFFPFIDKIWNPQPNVYSWV